MQTLFQFAGAPFFSASIRRTWFLSLESRCLYQFPRPDVPLGFAERAIMNYQFEGNESTSEAVERIAIEQLDKALDQTRAKGKLDDAVHDTRVCFKKLRGLIRLVRDELGDKRYKRENVFYRDLNRRLSDVRDTAALTEILDKLKERFANELTEDAFDSFRRSLTRAKRKRQAEKKKALVQVRKKIVVARKRVKEWSIKNDDFSAVGEGLARNYAQGWALITPTTSRPSRLSMSGENK